MQIYPKKDMITLATDSIIDPELHALFLKKTPFMKDPEARKKNNLQSGIRSTCTLYQNRAGGPRGST